MKKNFYITSKCIIKKENNTISITDTNNKKIFIPVFLIDNLFVFGEIDINKNTLSILSRHKVNVSFFNYFGSYMGSYIPKDVVTGNTLINQVNYIIDQEKKLKIAKKIISGSLKNCVVLLTYYNEDKLLDFIVNKINNELIKIDKAITIEELLMIEAISKKAYYDFFDIVIINKDYEFKKRTTRPAETRVNSLLNYGYSLLYSTIENVLHIKGLNNKLAFIHSNNNIYGGLQYDIADILNLS